MAAVWENVMKMYKTDEYFRRELKKQGIPLFYELLKGFLQKKELISFPINLDRCSRAISKLCNLDFRIVFLHQDIFRMLDIDGLNNDLLLYSEVMRNLESAGKLDKRLITLRDEIRANKKMFPTLEHADEIIIEYMKQVDTHLPREYRINAPSFQEFQDKCTDAKAAEELTNVVINSFQKAT